MQKLYTRLNYRVSQKEKEKQLSTKLKLNIVASTMPVDFLAKNLASGLNPAGSLYRQNVCTK